MVSYDGIGIQRPENAEFAATGLDTALHKWVGLRARRDVEWSWRKFIEVFKNGKLRPLIMRFFALQTALR